jgi:hypothetical protein
MKKLTLPMMCLTLFFVLVGPPLLLVSTLQPVEFISFESQDMKGVHMKNRILFQPGFAKDTWYMWQSLEDGSVPEDMLAITVEGGRATFYQLDPEKTDIESGKLVKLPYRASCMSCHSNGPRAIREKKVLAKPFLKPVQKVAIKLLNLRIKLYGRLQSVPHSNDPKVLALFHPLKKEQRAPLGLSSCKKCHSAGGIRLPLTNEQWWTAKHLVKTGAMPPWPFSISEEDKEKLTGSKVSKL